MPDPISIAVVSAIVHWLAAHGAAIALVVYALAVTVAVLDEWFSQRSAIGATDADVIGVEIANRLANRAYVEVQGVFRQPANTRIIQAIYNRRTGAVLDSRLVTSDVRPAQDVINRHEAGNGMVVFT